MAQLILLFSLVIFSIHCSGPRQKKPIARELNTATIPQRLAVVHGGFNSCGRVRASDAVEPTAYSHSMAGPPAPKASIFTGFHFAFVAGNCRPLSEQGILCHHKAAWLQESLVEKFAQTFAIDWFVSCQPFNVKQIHWVDSSAPSVEKVGTREEMWEALVAFAQGKPPMDIAGHSYGAWTAMHSVQKVSTETQSLTTIDPISPLRCPPNAIRRGSDECKRFPTDIDEWEQKTISSRTRTWDHYWQKLDNGDSLFDKGLHSGPITIANVASVELEETHLEAGVDEGVWSKFMSRLQSERLSDRPKF
jgi:hypothetical protein